jgi:aspartyl protease family protein
MPVVFLLDTGATQVSIPAHIAEELQLTGSRESLVNTANGTTTVYQTKLQQLSIGNIYLYDVSAHINPSMQSNQILLGMSALKRVEFSQVGKQLILREQ